MKFTKLFAVAAVATSFGSLASAEQTVDYAKVYTEMETLYSTTWGTKSQAAYAACDSATLADLQACAKAVYKQYGYLSAAKLGTHLQFECTSSGTTGACDEDVNTLVACGLIGCRSSTLGKTVASCIADATVKDQQSCGYYKN